MFKAFFLTLLLSSVSYGKVELPDYLEKGDLEKALPSVEGIVIRYERARALYEKKGPEAFVNSLSEKLSEEDVRPEDSYNAWLQLLGNELHDFFPVKQRKASSCPGCAFIDVESEFIVIRLNHLFDTLSAIKILIWPH